MCHPKELSRARRRRIPMPLRGHRECGAFAVEINLFDPLTNFIKRLPLHRSAFFVFCSEHRPKVKADHPGISIGDIAKKLGEMWSKQSPKDKAPFEQKAMKLKEKYEKVGGTLMVIRVWGFYV